MNDAPLHDLLIQASINTENQLMDFSDSSWQDCPDTGRNTGAYIIFYQGGSIDHGTNFPGPVSQSSAKNDYNAACTAGMALSHSSMLIHKLLNKEPDIIPEEYPLIILDNKSTVCMAKNGNDTKHTRHMTRRVNLVNNGENSKILMIDCCEGGLQLVHITTKNVGENDLNPRMKYILVRLGN